jgi:RecA-family ATPase
MNSAFGISITQLANALGGDVCNGQVLAPGPSHKSPRDRSLSVKLDSDAPDGLLVHSFAGDDPLACKDYVRERAGLGPFKPNGGSHRRHSPATKLNGNSRQPLKAPLGREVCAYPYRDRDGTVLYENVRYEPKTFRQRRPDGNGGWISDLDGSGPRKGLDGLKGRRVPYLWSELLEYPDGTVFVTEGEKDADRVAGLGRGCATTVTSGNWTNECVQALAGRDILILEDNDEPGRKKALHAAILLHRVAKSVRIVRFPGLAEGGDVSDWLDAGHDADELVKVCFDTPLWTPDTPAPAEPALSFINVVGWHDQPVPVREWCVPNRIPMHNVTLFSGEGAIGKSIVSLQLAVATALGKDWLNSLPEFGPAMVVCCEDDEDELHRRLSDILRHYGVTFTDLKDIHIISLAGQDALMAVPERNGLIKPTELFERLDTAARDIRPRLIVLDNSADLFGGNENDRAQVRQFIGILRGLAIAANAGVVLTSHPSLTGQHSGTGLSGSTAWHASVRSRLYMKRATTEKGEEPDPNLRVIEVMKSNYGPIGEIINMHWKDGVFVPMASMGNLDRFAAEQRADEAFYSNLVRFTRQGRTVSHKPTANAYAPAEFAREKEAREAGMRKADFEAAMRRLLTAEKIRVESYGPPSRGWTKLVTV